jgi:hypothetical protein
MAHEEGGKPVPLVLQSVLSVTGAAAAVPVCLSSWNPYLED